MTEVTAEESELPVASANAEQVCPSSIPAAKIPQKNRFILVGKFFLFIKILSVQSGGKFRWRMYEKEYHRVCEKLFRTHFNAYYTTFYPVKLLKECENFMPGLQICGYIEFLTDFRPFFGGKTLDI